MHVMHSLLLQRVLKIHDRCGLPSILVRLHAASSCGSRLASRGCLGRRCGLSALSASRWDSTLLWLKPVEVVLEVVTLDNCKPLGKIRFRAARCRDRNDGLDALERGCGRRFCRRDRGLRRVLCQKRGGKDGRDGGRADGRLQRGKEHTSEHIVALSRSSGTHNARIKRREILVLLKRVSQSIETVHDERVDVGIRKFLVVLLKVRLC